MQACNPSLGDSNEKLLLLSLGTQLIRWGVLFYVGSKLCKGHAAIEVFASVQTGTLIAVDLYDRARFEVSHLMHSGVAPEVPSPPRASPHCNFLGWKKRGITLLSKPYSSLSNLKEMRLFAHSLNQETPALSRSGGSGLRV
jgi:hypothetical protein